MSAEVGFEEALRSALGHSVAPQDLIPLVMENSPIGMALVGADGRINWINRALCRFLGRKADEIRGMSWSDFTHPDDRAESERLAAELVLGHRNSFRAVKRYLRPDGTVRWGDDSVTCLRDEQDAVMAYISQVLNVNDMITARQELATSRERYRLLAENASDVVSRADSEGILRWVSPSITELMGWQPEQLVGTRIIDLAHPEDRASFESWGRSLLAGEHARVRVRLRRADGSYRWISILGRPITDGQGKLLGRVAGWRDADAEVATEAALAASEEHYRLLAENASDIVIKTNGSERIEWISPSAASILDTDPQGLVGTRYSDLVHPEDLAARTEGSGSLRGDEVRVRVRGGWRWMSDLVQRLTDATGAAAGVIHSLRDIDSEREAREQLRFLAYHDSLTGLATREVAERHLELLLGQETRGAHVAALFIDMDGLKHTNDEFGHAVGDQVIIELARRLVANARSDDLVARFGGDEFVVILPSVRSTQDALVVAEKIRQAASTPVEVTGRQLVNSVSVGVALSLPGTDAADTLRRADAALYRAKRAGRNCIEVDTPTRGPTASPPVRSAVEGA